MVLPLEGTEYKQMDLDPLLQESLWYLNWAYTTEDTGQFQKCRHEVTEIALASDNMAMELEDRSDSQ